MPRLSVSTASLYSEGPSFQSRTGYHDRDFSRLSSDPLYKYCDSTLKWTTTFQILSDSSFTQLSYNWTLHNINSR